MENQYCLPQPTNEQTLIERYRERLKVVFKFPSPYYPQPLFEYSEIQQKIKELKRIAK